jgi:hypothetical protein
MTGRFPFFTVGSLLSAPVLALVSIPIWRIVIEHQIRNDPQQIYSPDPGQFGAFGVIAGVVLTALVSAALGAVLAIVAHVRREAFIPFRAITFTTNVALVGYGVYLLLPFRPR